MARTRAAFFTFQALSMLTSSIMFSLKEVLSLNTMDIVLVLLFHIILNQFGVQRHMAKYCAEHTAHKFLEGARCRATWVELASNEVELELKLLLLEAVLMHTTTPVLIGLPPAP